MWRLVSVEREVRLMKELLDGMMMKFELLVNENKEMKSRILKYDHIIETNRDEKGIGKYRKRNRSPEGKMCKL